jgi:hypothetical protein
VVLDHTNKNRNKERVPMQPKAERTHHETGNNKSDKAKKEKKKTQENIIHYVEKTEHR